MGYNNQSDFIYGETLSPEAPKPTATVYEILAQHLSKGGDGIESHAVLNDVYKALASGEVQEVRVLDSLEQAGVVSREETLIITVLLAVSRTLGPDLNLLRQAILTGHFDVNEINSILAGCGLDATIADYIQKIVPKLKR